MIAVYTPLTQDGTLDVTNIPAYAKFVAARNITNVLPAGSNGESLSLSVNERKALAEAWAAAAPPLGIKVYMHIGSESLVESQELAAHAASLNSSIAGLVCMAPVYFKPTVGTLHDFLAAVASHAPQLPFWFYHFPDGTGVLPGQAHTLLEMADKSGKIPNLMGIKFTDYNLMDFQLCLQVGSGYNMLFGRDEEALAALLLGADAAVSSTVGYSPTLRDAILLWNRGDRKGAVSAQMRNAKLCSFFAQYESDAKNVQKSLMKVVGMDVGPSRLPKQDLSSAELKSLQVKLSSLNLLDADVRTSAAHSTV
eukprot:gene13562-16035_t